MKDRKDQPRHCLTCWHEPTWQIVGYGTDRHAQKAGFCQKPMPFSDIRRSIVFDEEWNDGLNENCPAWEGISEAPTPTVEINRLRWALEKYRGQINQYGTESASEDLERR
jgi:hypothetical protein